MVPGLSSEGEIFLPLIRLQKMYYLCKTRSLETSFGYLFLSIDFKTDFKWAGTFVFTKDDLPFISFRKDHTFILLMDLEAIELHLM